MNYEDLFKAAFKTEFIRAHYFIVQFYADGKDFGNTEIYYDSAFTSFTFYSVPFSSYLDTVLLSNERSKINGADGYFNSKKLKDLNFEVDLNEKTYELKVNLPPEIKELQHLSLSGSGVPSGALIKPAFFSLYLNFRAYDYFRSGTIDDWLRDPLFFGMDGAAAMGGFVLEGSGSFSEPRKPRTLRNTIRRGDLRLVKDIYVLNTRLTLGDLGEVAGIRLEHSERLFNRNIKMPKHKINFFLPKANYVEIYIDGKLNRRLYLPSGQHEISGFAGHTGANTVQVFIRQPDGTLKEIKYEFELGSGNTPLRKGESRQYLNAGIRRTSVPTPTSYKYHPHEPGFNAEYGYGLFHNTSLGFMWQGSKQNLMTGLRLQNASIFGYSELAGYMNRSDSIPYYGKRIELSNANTIDALLNSALSFTAYYQNSTYNPSLFSATTSPSSEYAGFYGSFSIDFVSLNAGMYLNRETSPDYRLGISASKSILGISVNAEASSNFNENSSSYSASINFGYSFGIDRHYVSMATGLGRNVNIYDAQYAENPYYNHNPDYYYDPEYDPEYDPNYDSEYIKIPEVYERNWYRRAALGWGWSDGGGNTIGQKYSASVTVQDHTNSSIGANLGAYYSLNRAEMGANYNFGRYENPIGYSESHYANVSAFTSFMFADGLWAFGRPVRGGFILADVNNSLSGAKVRMNYSDAYDKDMSHNGALGAAYHNSISSYTYNTINIRLNDMPVGAYLEQNNYYVMGAYKQGYALRLGNDMRVFLQVRLKDEDGYLDNTYVAILQIGKDGKIKDKRTTFTSRDGLLQMGNLIPGEKYRLSFDPSTQIKDIDIDIPKDSEPFLELPDLNVETGAYANESKNFIDLPDYNFIDLPDLAALPPSTIIPPSTSDLQEISLDNYITPTLPEFLKNRRADYVFLYPEESTPTDSVHLALVSKIARTLKTRQRAQLHCVGYSEKLKSESTAYETALQRAIVIRFLLTRFYGISENRLPIYSQGLNNDGYRRVECFVITPP